MHKTGMRQTAPRRVNLSIRSDIVVLNKIVEHDFIQYPGSCYPLYIPLDQWSHV